MGTCDLGRDTPDWDGPGDAPGLCCAEWLGAAAGCEVGCPDGASAGLKMVELVGKFGVFGVERFDGEVFKRLGEAREGDRSGVGGHAWTVFYVCRVE